MSQHPSLRIDSVGMRHRNVLKRLERIKKLQEDEKWKEGASVFGLAKVKSMKIKVKKVKEEKAATEEGAAAEAPTAGAAGAAAGAKKPAASAKPGNKKT